MVLSGASLAVLAGNRFAMLGYTVARIFHAFALLDREDGDANGVKIVSYPSHFRSINENRGDVVDECFFYLPVSALLK